MNISKTEFNHLLERYLDGKTSSVETDFVEAYLRQVENGHSGQPEHMTEQDLEERSRHMFSVIESRIDGNGEEKKHTIFPYRGVRPAQYILASLAAAACVMIFFVFRSGQETNPGTSSRMMTVAALKGERYRIRLSDGTQVWLNAQSQLRFPDHFEGASREVYLEGEGYFEVSRDKRHPFRVHSGNLITNVLGTHFDIKAYKAASRVEVTLIEGKVMLTLNHIPRHHLRDTVYMLPNQRVTYLARPAVYYEGQVARTAKLSKAIAAGLKPGVDHDEDVRFMTESVRTADVALWKDGVLIFRDEKIASIIERLSQYYHVQIKADRLLAGRTVTITLKNQPVEASLLSICQVLNRRYDNNRARYNDKVQFKKFGNTYLIE